MERCPAKTLYHRCKVAITRVDVKGMSSGSSLDRFKFVYVLMPDGFHTKDAHSSLGRTRVRYAMSLTLWLHPPSTRRKRPRLELAFFQMLSACSLQSKLFDIVTPWYFVVLTLAGYLKCIGTGLESFYMLFLKENIFQR